MFIEVTTKNVGKIQLNVSAIVYYCDYIINASMYKIDVEETEQEIKLLIEGAQAF